MITCKDCPYWIRDKKRGEFYDLPKTGICSALPPKVFIERQYRDSSNYSCTEFIQKRPETHEDDLCIIPNEKPIIRHSFPNIE
jgi:hypothetical protein